MTTDSRVIKFRAWDKTNKRMIEPSVNMLIDSYSGKPWWQFGYAEPQPMPDIELMQFTGLTDKNGKEIYEGDAVKWTSIHNPSGLERTSIVTFTNGYWALMPWIHELSEAECEVIGNVHETPELAEMAE